MKHIPTDIIEQVKNDFKQEDWSLIFDELDNVSTDNLNVGCEQLIRSILTISQGNRYKLLNIRKKKYLGDPRDVISLANNINPNLDSGKRPFEIGELKKGWVSEYWTTDRNLSKQEKLKFDKWIYNNIFTKDQFNLKPKFKNEISVYQHAKLKGETLDEMIQLNNPFLKLPQQKVFENKIYSALKDTNKNTCCYTFSFNQSHAYHYDIGIYGEYEFENKQFNKVGNGILYPLYMNLFNEDVGNDFKYNYALGTGIISKSFDWYILLHFKNEKEMYIETLIGGELKITNIE